MSIGILTVVTLFVIRLGIPLAVLFGLGHLLRRWDDGRAAI